MTPKQPHSKRHVQRKEVVIPEALVVGHGKMHGKPVLFRDAKHILTYSEEFQEKGLCDGHILNLGDACVYSCEYCYVPAGNLKLDFRLIQKYNEVHGTKLAFRDFVIRRQGFAHLVDDLKGHPKINVPQLLFSSSAVDPAPNATLLKETADACNTIFQLTQWDIRLLSKSPLLQKLVEDKLIPQEYHQRLIFGFSTGTLDSRICGAIETGTPPVDKRLEALYWLQDRGFRTYAMLCPCLPQESYEKAAKDLCDAVRVEKCEHVWAEVINSRGNSLKQVEAALEKARYGKEAASVATVRSNKDAWENYARGTFLALKEFVPANKLRFLQYVTEESRSWWEKEVPAGALLLGKKSEIDSLKESEKSLAASVVVPPLQSTAAPKPKQGWPTVEQRMANEIEALKRGENPFPVLPMTHPIRHRLAIGATLTDAEMDDLSKQETLVDTGLKASIEAAKALYIIRNYKSGLYWKSLNFDSFEAYCLARFQYTKSHAYRLAGAGRFVEELEKSTVFSKSPIGDWRPLNENQIRPILSLPESAQVTAWEKVVTKTRPGDLTGSSVARVVRDYAAETGVVLQTDRKQGSRKIQAKNAIGRLNAVIKELPSEQQKPFAELLTGLEVLISNLTD